MIDNILFITLIVLMLAYGLAVATINRMLKKGFEPYKTNARYFSDILRDAEWFDGL